MRQTRAVIIAFMGDKDLRLTLKATKGGTMDDTVFIALKRATLGGTGLGDTPSATFYGVRRINSAFANGRKFSQE